MRDWLEAGAMFIYVPIGDEVRYDADIRRGRTWTPGVSVPSWI